MLRVALVALAVLVAAAPAAAQQPKLCVGQGLPKPPPTAAEKEQANLEHWAAQRAEFGFRHDLPYVRELVRRGVWEYDVGYIPVTPKENEYLKLRDKLDIGARASRYLKAHSDVDGGVSVEDNWPHEPYLLLHLKRDVAKHLAAMRQLVRYPDNLRAVRIRYSERELGQITDRIWKDAKKLNAIGFHVVSTSSTLAAEVDMITKRPDAREFFRKHYGPAVKTRVIATEEFTLGCVEAGSYTVAEDGLSVTVSWGSGGSQEPGYFEVTEYPDRVEIGVVDRLYNGPQNDDARTDAKPATLSAPLGDRVVVDAYNGRVLQQIGPRPGQPPCPPAAAEPDQLQQAMATRAAYGMRADAGYVQARLNGRSLYTVAEARWLARLERVKREDEPLDERLARDFPKTYAGSVPVTRYPAAPHFVYRFTRDAQSHLAAIRRRSRSARVGAATVPLAQLDALEDTIQKSLETTREFDAFHVLGAQVDRVTGTVIVSLVTSRTDHAAYFAAKYGPLVRTEVVAERYECYLADRRFG